MSTKRDRSQRQPWQIASERMKLESDAIDRMDRYLRRSSAHRHQGNASQTIRALLDRARGQPRGVARSFLREVVSLVEEGVAPPDWRRMIESEYPTLVGDL